VGAAFNRLVPCLARLALDVVAFECSRLAFDLGDVGLQKGRQRIGSLDREGFSEHDWHLMPGVRTEESCTYSVYRGLLSQDNLSRPFCHSENFPKIPHFVVRVVDNGVYNHNILWLSGRVFTAPGRGHAGESA